MITDKIVSSIQFRLLNRFSFFNPLLKIRNELFSLYTKNDVNICYNKYIRKTYDPQKQNILVAIESPAMIEYYRWIDANMKFVAEISFSNYFKLNQYLCPRTLYVNNDNFVEMNEFKPNAEKPELVSMIYSDKSFLYGHQFRHRISKEYKDKIHLYGSGTGRHLKRKSDSLGPYKFQIVIENGKYPEYVTEKFYDCLKTNTIPIYWGGEEAIHKMGFDQNGILFFDKLEDLEEILNEKVHRDYYFEKRTSVEFNRNRLIEIRNEDKLLLVLNALKLGYHHTTKSYSSFHKGLLNLKFEDNL